MDGVSFLGVAIVVGLLLFGYLAGQEDGPPPGVFAVVGLIFAVLALLAALGEISV